MITEVLADPTTGATQFVELMNLSNQPVVLTSLVLHIDTLPLPLPRLSAPVAAGGRVVIRFDGRGTTDGSVVHAGPGFQLRPAGGRVTLKRNDDRALDFFAWGDVPGAFVPTIGGLAARRLVQGTSYGRPPGANRPGRLADWVAYGPGRSTPGAPNPLPSVAQLLPVHGAMLETTSAELGWYTVPGAVRYRVQIARDTAFRQPLLDRVVATPQLSTGSLEAGVYWWRVQAMAADGAPAAWSDPSQLELGVPPPPSGGGNDGAYGLFVGGPSETTAGGDGSQLARVLNVPLLFQHKDTKMLHLEVMQEGRSRTSWVQPPAPHSWNRDHGTLDQNDPADNQNCALASLAMINHFYGGDLSQDRIGYEGLSRNIQNYRGTFLSGAGGAVLRRLSMFKASDFVERQPGPEQDLHHSVGMPWGRAAAGGVFALGTIPGSRSAIVPPFGFMSNTDLWDAVVAETNAGRPLFAWVPGHAIVIRGYDQRAGRRVIHINDPWEGRYAMDIDAPNASRVGLGIEGIWTYDGVTAKHQEPEVTTDSDTDGVFDFDEINRFRTDPRKKDTDGDGVEDLPDIASGAFELVQYLGYAYQPGQATGGRDFDVDGMPTELDADSDNGGCKDGDEDTNGNGETDGTETDNFDPTDDSCGNLQGSVSYWIQAVNSDPNGVIKEVMDKGVIQVRLKPESPGSDQYVDAGSTYSYEGYGRLEIQNGTCTIWGLEYGRGGGQFVGNDVEIGAVRGDDRTLAFGARASVPAVGSAHGCGGPAGTTPAERILNFPDCVGTMVPPSTRNTSLFIYRFSCATHPPMPPGWTVTKFYARGYIEVR